jgi:hypothetical protein
MTIAGVDSSWHFVILQAASQLSGINSKSEMRACNPVTTSQEATAYVLGGYSRLLSRVRYSGDVAEVYYKYRFDGEHYAGV